MKKRLHKLFAFLAVLTALPSIGYAQDAASPVSFNIGVVSDYRYRGISQSRVKPALQGGIDYANPNGLYLGTWASSIKWIDDAGGNDSVEIDLYGGYKGEIVKEGLSFDVGLLTYQYPGNDLPTSANTTEIYGALTYGVATVKYSHSVSNLFGFADSKNSGYLDLSASFDLGNGLSLAPHVGHQKVAGAGNGDYSYTDYSLTLGKDMGNGLSLSVAVVGTDHPKVGGTDAYFFQNADGSGFKSLQKAGLVVGAKFSF